jgi:uncharacterized protein YbaP (TraB family)
MGRFIRCGLVVLGLFGGLTAHTTAQSASPVWELRGKHNTVYLAGSIHMLKAGESQLPAGFEKAYEDSEALLMEVDLDDLDPLEAQGWMMTHARFPEGKTLLDALGKERYDIVAEESSKLGVPIEGLAQFEPWMIALTLVQLEYMKLGFNPEQGVEKQLERRAVADKKEITGLETLPEQLGLLDGMSDEDQARFLELTVNELENVERETDLLLAAWRGGNLDKLDQLLTEEYDAFPGLFKTLVSDRNKRWMPALQKLLNDEKKDYLVVVGALHLVGKEGLLDMMQAQGIKARQLQ